ncbi:MAG: YraN family protein [Thermomicrobiales bacterium]
MTATNRTRLGHAGEHFARGHLEVLGWTFVAANWQCRAGEIDLVMRDADELVFVEVKLRRGERSGSAEEAVSLRKAQRLMAAADYFLAQHPAFQNLIWRIDLLAITLDASGAVSRTSHIENAILSG